MATLTVYAYSRCDTCRKAIRWLEAHQHSLKVIDITITPPALNILEKMFTQSQLPLAQWLNRSGEAYRSLNLKEKLKTLPQEQILKMMAENGKLIKRPVITDGKQVTVGFNEEAFKKHW